MKINQLKIIGVILFCISSISAYAQLICELGNRTPVVTNSTNFEYSGLAYHQNRNILFMPLDDELQNTRIRAYDSNTGNSFSVDLEGTFNDFDFEGLTWLEQDYFVLVEEKENEIYFLKYIHSTNINNRKFTVLGRHSTGIPFVQIGNDEDGLEGIAYNPHIKTLYLVSEMDYKMYSIPIVLPQASNNNEGALLLTQTSSVQLPFSTGACASGIFHLGLNVAANHPLSNNILVLSDELRKVFEFKLTLNANNQLTSNSLLAINDFPLGSEPQPEGVVVIGNNLYIASELTGGGLSSYPFKTGNDSCNDGDSTTINDRYDANCNCIGDIPGCTDAVACNFNGFATADDGSCNYAIPNYNCAGVCIVMVDCNGNCGGTAIAGTTCNDGNIATINDRYDANCNCIGDLLGCTDTTACNFNGSATVDNGSCTYAIPNYNCAGACLVAVDCNGNCGGTAIQGTACNDGNPDTANDTYNGNCECTGEPICPAEVIINNNTSVSIALQNLYESSQLIKTEVTASSGVDVIIKVNEVVDLKSDHITLNEGFKVESGGCLNAVIEPCD